MSTVFLELTCRVLPVSDSLKALPVNETNPILRFEENRDITWSRGPTFSIITHKHVNNYGFLNDQDYRLEYTSPLLAIIGDSYVEAAQVENRDSMHGILSKRTGGRGRVYSFGTSGSPLSNYLAYAKYATGKFHADALVFMIVGNDFDESLTKYNTTPGFHYFSDSSDHLEYVRKDYDPSFVRRLLRKSALVRYVTLNGEVSLRTVTGMFSNGEVTTREEFVGNTLADAREERVSDSIKAIDMFFQELPLQTGLEHDRILFVLDGMRPDLYDEGALMKAGGSYFDLMRRHFMEVAANEGYEVVDLQPAFIKKHQSEGIRFEFPSDGHWNEAGHSLVAEEISASTVYRALFER